jgi:uncharacterized protein
MGSSPLRCSICGKSFQPDQSPAMPFCSHRCRLIDLKRWLGEEYHLPWERIKDEGGGMNEEE